MLDSGSGPAGVLAAAGRPPHHLPPVPHPSQRPGVSNYGRCHKIAFIYWSQSLSINANEFQDNKETCLRPCANIWMQGSGQDYY